LSVAYLSLGSNDGDRKKNIDDAVYLVSCLDGVKVKAQSSLHCTAHVSDPSAPYFLNAVIKIETAMPPEALLESLLDIEKKLGRVRVTRWGPRTIDIDILMYDDLIYDSDTLTIPHPLFHERKFVLELLCEIDSQLRHPVLDATVSELLQSCEEI
jgi:2-amino-4-hydroxy-6-hydroxymethyldihydropteridine diphosphokinase